MVGRRFASLVAVAAVALSAVGSPARAAEEKASKPEEAGSDKPASATAPRFGLGVKMTGSSIPNAPLVTRSSAGVGLTGKVWFAERFATQLGFGFSAGDPASTLFLDADFLYNAPLTGDVDKWTARFYFGGGFDLSFLSRETGAGFAGGGGGGGDISNTELAVSVPLGFQVDIEQAGLEVFMEASTDLWVTNPVIFGLGGAIGARYYF